jgi:hypothetical protein
MDDSAAQYQHYQDTGELPAGDQRIEKLKLFATSLLTEASELQKQISGAKTQYKRDFYGKKMKKVRDTITQALSTIEILNLTSKGSENASSPAEPTITI